MGGGGGIGAGLGSMIGGLLGNSVAGGDRGQAREAADRAYQELMNIGLPPDLAKPIIMKEFQRMGVLTPELEQHIELGASKVAQIQEDPSLRKAQTDALNMLASRAQGGFNAEDRANINKIKEEFALEEQAKQAQIIQNMQQRGMGGAGAELAAMIASNQSGANRASRSGDELAAQASRNALEAARQYGGMASQVRNQDFDISREKAAAEDLTNRFNVQNRQNVQSRNVGARNQAQEYNLSQEQRIADANATLANRELLRQNDEKANYYNRMLDRAGLRSGAEQRRSQDFAKRAQATIDQSTAIGSGLGQIAESAIKGMSGGGAAMSMPEGDSLDYTQYENTARRRGGPF